LKKNWLKTVAAGSLTAALAVGIMLPASAAAANPTTYTTVTYKITDAASLKAVLEQWKKQLEQFNQGTTTQKPADQTTGTTTPAKPTNPTPTKPSDNGSTSNNGSNSGSETSQSDFAAQVVKLVNAERAKAGLSALTSDALLNKVAAAKVKDMSDNNYFDHQSPTYGSPFDMMKQFGVTYTAAGENIAKGQKTPQEVVTAWMNSDGHRKNILNANFTHIGVGYYNGYWAQEFIGK